MSLINKLSIVIVVLAIMACQDGLGAPANAVTQDTATSRALSETERLDESLTEVEAKMGLRLISERFTGDLDVLAEKRIIRVLTVYGLGRYFLDGPQEKGMTYEYFKMFEAFVNERFKTRQRLLLGRMPDR